MYARPTVLAVLTAWLLLCAACSEKPVQSEEKLIRPVRVAPVTLTGGKRLRTFSGTARAGVESKLSFRIAGSVMQFTLNLGDRVQKDQVIARLDPKDYELQVQEAEAGLAQAIAQARNASANYERIRGLYENNNVSINDLDAARTQMESANAQVVSIRKRLELANSQLTYTTLHAPLAGYIAQILVEEDENVNAGTPVAVLNAGSHPEVTFAVPEQLIAKIKVGAQAKVRFDSLGTQEFNGTVTEVGVATAQLATTYPVVVRLGETPSEIRPGMAAEVTLILGETEDHARLFVKPIAVVEDRTERFVFVATPQAEDIATVTRRTVETGALTEDGLEILSGLEEGELLITAGIRFLKEGMEVRIPAAGKE